LLFLQDILFDLNHTFSFKIYKNTSELPEDWDVLASGNIFLSSTYFRVLEQSGPKNMTCHFIGLYKNDVLVGISLTQLLDLTSVSSFGVNKSCIKSKLRDFAFRKFSSHVLFVGNNMLTGQNSYLFNKETNEKDGIILLQKAVLQLIKNLKKSGITVHLTSIKDFGSPEKENFKIDEFSKYYAFSGQPNMVFYNQSNWKTEEDYVVSLNKKYRDHYKRSRKKSELVTKRQMSFEEIIKNEAKINQLYLNVTKNAPFNTFYLAENHFSNLKEILEDKFLFYGYFLEDKLIGFNTMIVNGNALDTYFLGYDDVHQKEKMLYLNMLYDMIGYSITKGFEKLIFSRTAIEIKSSVGAKPINMVGFVKHSNWFINLFIGNLFRYFDPEVSWIERNPFK
jgi:predicted N-acyltransferase